MEYDFVANNYIYKLAYITMKQVKAPMAAIVIEIKVKLAQMVREGMEVALLESMKMQIPVLADCAGKVSQIHAAPQDFVNEGQPIITLEE
jgi:acetyl-CoA carboxylase biotin carboxyl carrier protein